LKRRAGYFDIVRKEKISSSIYKFVFHSPEITSNTAPGQFVQIRTSDDYFPLWPRPFSVYDTDKERGEFAVIFKVFGCGTSQLADYSEGDKIHILGPLGNGFAPPGRRGKIIMAAGGVGLPPLYLLAKEAVGNGFSPHNIAFISGARTREDHFDDGRLAALGVDLKICTDDGSYGARGTVVDLLKMEIRENIGQTIYACGPSAMLEKIDLALTYKNIPGFLSLEALMPCGIGICSGCAVKTIPSNDRGPTDDNRDYHLKRVCVDGPVFKAGEVIWK
jgi:dihydroorotate dehydrogenase electron transfer subunit